MKASLLPLKSSLLLACSLLFITVNPALAATFTWNGGSAGPGDSNWTTASNWSTNVAPASDGTAGLVFEGAQRLAAVNNFSTGTAFTRLDFGNTASNFVLSGASIAMNDGVIAVFDTAPSTGFDSTVNLDIAITGTLDLRTTDAVSSGADLTIGGVISGTGNLLKSVTSVMTDKVILTAANTYTGTTTIQAGVLSINTIKNVSGGASSLGNPTTPTNGTITMGGAVGNPVQLIYTGTAAQTDRVIDLALSTVLQTITQSGTGLLKFTSDLTATGTGAKTLTLNGSTAGTGELSGKIVNGFATVGVAKSGSGTWTLSNTASTYTGATVVTGGVLSVSTIANGGVPSSIGQSASIGGLILGTGGTMQYTGALTTTDRGFSVRAGGGNLDASGTGAITFSGNVTQTQAGGRTLGLNGSNTGANTLSGVIGDRTALTELTSITKSGTGKWALTGANTYTGATTVDSGTLVVGVGGVGSITSDVTVNNTGTLGGSGTITGDILIASGGTHAPGNSPGIQTITGTANYAANSIFEWELNANTTANRGTDWDGVDITNSNVTIDSSAIFKIVIGGTVDFNGIDNFWDSNRSWQVFGNGSSGSSIGSFLNIQAPTASYISYYPNGGFSFDNTTGTLNWTLVPEPSGGLAGVLVALGLLRRRRGR